MRRFTQTLEEANEFREEMSGYVTAKVVMSLGMRDGEISRIDWSRVNTAG